MDGSGMIGAVAALSVVSGLAACDSGGVIKSVGRRDFRVPREHVLAGSYPGVPVLGRNDFLYIVNPEAPLPERMTVVVDPLAGQCRDEHERLQTCGVKPVAVLGSDSLNNPLRLSPRDPEMPRQWRYQDRDGRDAADCISIKGAGSCHVVFECRALVCTMALPEANLSDLPRLAAKVQQQLKDWEVE
jgi:hypothetical protein